MTTCTHIHIMQRWTLGPVRGSKQSRVRQSARRERADAGWHMSYDATIAFPPDMAIRVLYMTKRSHS